MLGGRVREVRARGVLDARDAKVGDERAAVSAEEDLKASGGEGRRRRGSMSGDAISRVEEETHEAQRAARSTRILRLQVAVDDGRVEVREALGDVARELRGWKVGGRKARNGRVSKICQNM